MAYSPETIANTILKRSFDEKLPINLMKLQKILFFVAAEYSKKTRSRLLGDSFQAWKYGPVVYSLYTQFQTYGPEEIETYAKDALGEAQLIEAGTDAVLDETIAELWELTKHRRGVDLARITQLPGSAWLDAWQHQHRYVDDQLVLADTTYRIPLGIWQ